MVKHARVGSFTFTRCGRTWRDVVERNETFDTVPTCFWCALDRHHNSETMTFSYATTRHPW